MTQVCARCGYALAEGDRFCANCGALAPGQEPLPPKQDITGTIHSLGTNTTDSGPMPSVQPPELTPVEPGTHVLVIVRGPAAGSRIDLAGEQMTVGRSPDTDIFLDDITVSRQHAHFDFDGDGWKLVDLGSLNGSYVNRKRVDQVQLMNGDEIQIGKYRFHYVNGNAAEIPK